MKYNLFLFLVTLCVLSSSCTKLSIDNFDNYNPINSIQDIRCIENGSNIKSNNYIDQPYLLKLADNSWLCTYTYSDTAESALDVRIGIAKSLDYGKTWTETSSNLDSFLCSYSIPFQTSSGRVYIFYSFNNKKVLYYNNSYKRMCYEFGGLLAYKYSDDFGKTWSNRFSVSIPFTNIDFTNQYNGTFNVWWSICKPILANGQMYFAFSKKRWDYGEGFIANCTNINTEIDPNKLIWNFYPSNLPANLQIGIRNPIGTVQEEHNIQQLNDGGFCCLSRTNLGYPLICYSHDNAKTWSNPLPVLYSNGDTIRNPRACPRVFKCDNGKYLLWNHNDSYTSGHRSIGWLSGGIEKNGVINWSQPEIALYTKAEPTFVLMSYPDMIQFGSDYYITETQKKNARINKISPTLLNNLWNQDSLSSEIVDGRLLEIKGDLLSKSLISNISIPNFYPMTGYCIQLKLDLSAYSSKAPQTYFSMFGKSVLDTVFRIKRYGEKRFGAELLDSNRVVCSVISGNETINTNNTIVLSFNVDRYAKVFSGMINGILFRGDQRTLQGWSRILQSMNQTYSFNKVISVNNTDNNIQQLSIYSRYLTTSEQISNYRFLISK